MQALSSPRFCAFPDDFIWGAATSAYQIEGAAFEDGRAESVWDTFCRRPGVIAEDQNGERAIDHFHRYKEDVTLMRDMGLQAYRFSISWPRIFPDGDGRVNQKGIDFYERLIDDLLSAGIEPWATLFHWDLPQALQDRYDGWESKECAYAFAQYAELIAKTLGDRLKGIFTFNEFSCFLDKAHIQSDEMFAPGKPISRSKLNQARHHAILAHGLGVQAIRGVCSKNVRIGLAENIPSCVPVRETPDDIHAARMALREQTGMYLAPILEGAYDSAYLTREAADAPSFNDEEMKIIHSPIDFVGLNLYAPQYIRSDSSSASGWRHVPCDSNYPRMQMPWLWIGPAILYWGPRLINEIWKVPAIYITENGCASAEQLSEDNEVWDTARVMYLQQHLIHAHRAVSEGIPLKGYFIWSLCDNFEWTHGYTRRFGIHHVNYTTLERTPKLSAKFYGDIIRRNAIGEHFAAQECN